MDKTTFDLEASSAAVIFHNDMSMELILPKMEDDDVVDFQNNQNIFVAMAIASLADDPEFRKFVGARLQTMLDTAQMMAEDDENTIDCSPGGCSGGCCGMKDPGDGS